MSKVAGITLAPCNREECRDVVVQSCEELGLAWIAEPLVAKGQSVSGTAVNVGHKLSKMLQIGVSNLGSRAHDQSADEDEAILAVF